MGAARGLAVGDPALVVGVWALVLPRSFYDDFPAAGRHWVSALGPYNEHLVRDVRQWAVLLITYKRDGTPVGTPVSIAVEGERAFVRTWDTAWKFRRIRSNPEVEVAPCTASWSRWPIG